MTFPKREASIVSPPPTLKRYSDVFARPLLRQTEEMHNTRRRRRRKGTKEGAQKKRRHTGELLNSHRQNGRWLCSYGAVDTSSICTRKAPVLIPTDLCLSVCLPTCLCLCVCVWPGVQGMQWSGVQGIVRRVQGMPILQKLRRQEPSIHAITSTWRHRGINQRVKIDARGRPCCISRGELKRLARMKN